MTPDEQALYDHVKAEHAQAKVVHAREFVQLGPALAEQLGMTWQALGKAADGLEQAGHLLKTGDDTYKLA